jgi:hypothetical protein
LKPGGAPYGWQMPDPYMDAGDPRHAAMNRLRKALASRFSSNRTAAGQQIFRGRRAVSLGASTAGKKPQLNGDR